MDEVLDSFVIFLFISLGFQVVQLLKVPHHRWGLHVLMQNSITEPEFGQDGKDVKRSMKWQS